MERLVKFGSILIMFYSGCLLSGLGDSEQAYGMTGERDYLGHYYEETIINPTCEEEGLTELGYKNFLEDYDFRVELICKRFDREQGVL